MASIKKCQFEVACEIKYQFEVTSFKLLHASYQLENSHYLCMITKINVYTKNNQPTSEFYLTLEEYHLKFDIQKLARLDQIIY